jgi:DNA-binding transcriptional ArsR family regulator
MSEEQPSSRYVPLDGARLKALAHPLRVQLLDTLSTYGPATASALADRLGESSGATSYHLRQLEKSGFVREDAARGNARERWWERIPGSLSVDVAGLPDDSAERAAGELILAEWSRTRRRLLDDFLTRGERLLPPEWLAASDVTTMNLLLTSEQLAQLNSELDAVAERYKERYRGQTGPDVRPVEMQLNLFPVVDAGPALSPKDAS